MNDLTFKQASAKLKKIARYEYASIELRQQHNLLKTEKTEHIVYMSGHGHFIADNWKTALNKLEKSVTKTRNKNILPSPEMIAA